LCSYHNTRNGDEGMKMRRARRVEHPRFEAQVALGGAAIGAMGLGLWRRVRQRLVPWR
jgi:hypothetical protein